jgi:choline dehydrogenase-like flavoprotein
MGNDPTRSVVDSGCRSHDIPNLYILDGSVFVSSSGFNPTATIAAIALRAVHNIIENRTHLPRAL